MAFANNPKLNDNDGNNKIRRYVHQPLDIDHHDIHCKIQKNGRVKLTRPVKGSDEYDEIEVPASLIFKIQRLLQDTRKVEWVSVSELKPEELSELKETEAVG